LFLVPFPVAYPSIDTSTDPVAQNPTGASKKLVALFSRTVPGTCSHNDAALGKGGFGPDTNYIPEDVDDLREVVISSLSRKHGQSDLLANFFAHAGLPLEP
jgi:hypothetical protein